MAEQINYLFAADIVNKEKNFRAITRTVTHKETARQRHTRAPLTAVILLLSFSKLASAPKHLRGFLDIFVA